jgi:hypothetical protein
LALLLLPPAPARADECRSPRAAEAPARRSGADDRAANAELPAVDTTLARTASPPPAGQALVDQRRARQQFVPGVAVARQARPGRGLRRRAGACAPDRAQRRSRRPIVPTLPSLSIGLRSVTAGPPPNSLIERASRRRDPGVHQRVGLEWKPAQSSVFVRGGLRSDRHARVTIGVKSGRIAGLHEEHVSMPLSRSRRACSARAFATIGAVTRRFRVRPLARPSASSASAS